jgi:hypothetical protein
MHYILQQARTHRDFFCTQKWRVYEALLGKK